MGQALPILTLATQMNAMDEQHNRAVEKQRQLQKQQQADLEKQMASRRARQYAGGYMGKSYDEQLNRIKNQPVRQLRTKTGNNGLNRINLFAKVIDKMGVK